ncbi:MAG: KUP/HAK/KT family potassium transporter, partial [Candidatus Sumerlaeaceae bacterium]
AISNPFYLMAPRQLLIPVVIVATSAAVIASQALITGVFSLSMQASQLGFIPRVFIRHTSKKEMGQIYVAGVNWVLLVACIGLVLGFRSSSHLAAAYGVAVTTTMVITTILFHYVARERWNWNPVWAGVLCGVFLVIDLSFWMANMLKIPHGGWFPLVIGAAGFIVMTTWKKGRRLLASRLREKVVLVPEFVSRIEEQPPQRVAGTAVFMSSNPMGTPPALLHSLEHYGVLHQLVLLLSIEIEDVPHIAPGGQLEVHDLGQGIYSGILHYGFMDKPDVPAALANVETAGIPLDAQRATYFLGRENLVSTRRRGMARWQQKVFAMMSQNARSAASYFQLPPERVVELGIQVEL